MPQSLDMLIAKLDTLLDDLTQAEAGHADAIDAVASAHRRGAVNLVHYTILRQHDRRELQNDLMDIGATSLATTEAHVQAKVRAARNVLAALRRDTGSWNLDAINNALDEGDRILSANSDAVFGPMRPGRPTRIMVTFPGEAADDPGFVASLLDAGMDVARINCAHDDRAAWARMAQDPSRGHGRHVTFEDVQITAADGGGVDLDDRIVDVTDHGVGDIGPFLGVCSLVNKCLHGRLLEWSVETGCDSPRPSIETGLAVVARAIA